jgi:hypothetical protein
MLRRSNTDGTTGRHGRGRTAQASLAVSNTIHPVVSGGIRVLGAQGCVLLAKRAGL